MTQTLGLVALVVRDYDEAIAFYVGILGFTLIEDSFIPEQNKRWVVVAPPGSAETRLLLARASSGEQVTRIGNQTGGRVFLFLHTDDFARDYQSYKAKGVIFAREPRKSLTAPSPCFKISTVISGISSNPGHAPRFVTHDGPDARSLLSLELQVLVRRRVGVHRDQAKPGLGDARPDAVQPTQLPDGRVHDLVVHELLDLDEDRLALLPVQLGGLLLEESVDIGVAAVGIDPLRVHERLQARGRVAQRRGAAPDQVAKLLLTILGEEGRPLERPQLYADADCLPVVGDGLTHAGVGAVDEVFAAVDAVRVACLGQELPGPGRVEGERRRCPRELVVLRDHAPGQPRVPESPGLIECPSVHRQVGGQTDPAVRPR